MSLARRLIAAGFNDLEKGERFLAAPELDGLDQDALFAGLQLAANPDTALQSLVRLIEKHPDLRKLAAAEPDRSEPLYRVLGASEALGEFLIRHPEHLDAFHAPASPEPVPADAAALRTRLLQSVRADPKAARPVAGLTGQEGYAALRTAYRRGLVELADQGPLRRRSARLHARRRAPNWPTSPAPRSRLPWPCPGPRRRSSSAPAEVADVGLAVIGMGKCGARELNYISDVDVIYVIDAGAQEDSRANTIGTALASGISRAIMSTSREPGLWEVDANLRPEGKSGPLVRTLASHESYYARWAESWEFQALLKARTIAGDAALGARYEAAVAPLIWASAGREGFVESVRSMRRRVTEHIPAEEEQRQIKLGRGGLRDVEFTVQLLQLVHGKSDETLRCRDTTSAIAALSAGGYIGRSDAREFDRDYRYLRLLEHRIQLFQLRRTHLMPVKEASLRSLAKAVLGPFSNERPHPDALLAAWRKTKRSVRELHERIFYRPLLNTAAALSSEEARLTPEAAQGRLAALGYLDPPGAMRHIEALTGGVSRRAALQRQLLPILLGWLAEGVDPDGGLLAFRRVSEALGTTHWYLGLLRDSTAAAERLCHVLSNSRLISDLLEVSPESVAWLGSDKDLVPLSYEAQWLEITSKMSRHADPESAMRLIRLIRRREILRIAIADSAGLLDQDQVGAALADTDRAAVLGALRVAETVVTRRGAAEDPGAGGGDGTPGRPGDRLRLRRRRHVRAPWPARRPGGRGAAAGGPDRRQALQPADPAAQAGHPGRARADGGRGPAPGGQERADGAVPGVVRRVLPPLVPDLGGPGVAAGQADGRRRRARRRLRGAD